MTRNTDKTTLKAWNYSARYAKGHVRHIWLQVDLSVRFCPWPVCVGYVVGKMALGQVVREYFSIPPSELCHHRSILIR